MTQTDFKPVRKAVFPVAGLGTRFLPATKAMPKEMLPLVDRPLIQHAVDEARDAGIEEFIFITGRSKELLEQHFDYQPELENTLKARGKDAMVDLIRKSEMPDGKLYTTRQQRPLGLGHAVWCAKKFVGDEPFAVILPDDVVLGGKGCLSQMMDAYADKGGNVVAVMDVPSEDTNKYGILDVHSDDGKYADIKGLVEKPKPEDAPSTLSIIGRYILQPEVFEYLAAFETGAGGEIQLTDAMARLIGRQPFNGLRFEGTRYDCGSRLGFVQANIAFAMHDPEIGASVREFVKNCQTDH
ncbi:MAG: UTP--glucose-1-phosphate uridylyltransferase GalU [Alphaproteobacteria bacterium]|nr:UTP--glucose-1-phosphate uridylyltransferase GalU [Alphaproteobacteria bacterium]